MSKKRSGLANDRRAYSYCGCRSVAAAEAPVVSTESVYLFGTYEGEPLAIYNSGLKNSGLEPLPITSEEGINSSLIKYNENGIAQWATYTNNGGYCNSDPSISAITTDTLNNIYVSGGYVRDSLAIYDSDDRDNPVLFLPEPNGENSSLIKYNASGIAQWATYTTVTEGGGSYASAITSDTFNNIYVAGIYSIGGSLAIYNSDDLDNPVLFLPEPNGANSSLIKYNASGIAQWATYTTTGEGGGGSYASAITIDTLNNIYVAGIYEDGYLAIYDSDDRINQVLSLPEPNGTNSSLIKYNASGIAQWATYTTNNLFQAAYFFRFGTTNTTDTLNNIYVAGIYAGGPLAIYDSDDLDNPTNLSLPEPNGTNSSLIKYNASGIAQWATYTTTGEGGGGSYACAITTDTFNNIYVASGYNSGGPLLIYDSDDRINQVLSLPEPTGDSNSSLIKYNASGIVQWASYTTTLTEGGRSLATEITTDTFNNIYVSGFYGGGALLIYSKNLVFSGLTLPAPSANEFNKYTIKYDKDGNAKWATYTRTQLTFDPL
jgi:hypothetical protein